MVAKVEFGNTLEHAAKMLKEHWKKDHNGDAGNENRPYTCMACRGLWYRVSAHIILAKEDLAAVPAPYLLIVEALSA